MSLPNSLTLHLDITGYPCKRPRVSSECSEAMCKGKDLLKEAPKLWGVCSGVVVPPNVQVSHHSLPAKRVLGLLLLQLLPGKNHGKTVSWTRCSGTRGKLPVDPVPAHSSARTDTRKCRLCGDVPTRGQHLFQTEGFRQDWNNGLVC